jgi:ATP-dependent RNA helicase RhlE
LSELNYEELEDFKLSPKARVLVIVNKDAENLTVSEFACILHFDIPEDEMIYTKRLLLRDNTQKDQLALTFSTELELDIIKKLEQRQGRKMQKMDLPEELFIVKDKVKKSKEE